MKKKNSFTMVELIFTIMIMGILAATVIPKFTSIQDDAKITSEMGAVGGIRSGIAMTHIKWLLGRDIGKVRFSEDGKSEFDWDKDDTPEKFQVGGYLLDLDTGEDAKIDTRYFSEILQSMPLENWTEIDIGVYQGPASDNEGGVMINRDYLNREQPNKGDKWIYKPLEKGEFILEKASS